MRVKYIKSTFQLGVSIAGILMVIACLNVFFDHFGVFKSSFDDYQKQKLWPNERFSKMNYILANKSKYDSFILGSSHVIVINPQRIPDGKWYSLNAPTLNLYEYNRELNLLLKNDVKIKSILLVLGNQSFRVYRTSFFEHCSNVFIGFLAYPQNIIEYVYFYAKYLTFFPFIDESKYDKWDDGARSLEFVTGTSSSNKSELKLEKPKTFKTPVVSKDEYNPNTLSQIENLVKTCKSNNIKLTVMIVPEYYLNYEANDIKTYNLYKKRLASITPYYDFSGKNEITTDSRYFNNISHFNAYAGAFIIDRIFKEDKNSPPKIKNFGNYISQENADQHIANLCKGTPGVEDCSLTTGNVINIFAQKNNDIIQTRKEK